MKISIDPKILENFPDAKIGWLRAGVADAGGAAHVRALKAGLEARLNGQKRSPTPPAIMTAYLSIIRRYCHFFADAALGIGAL